MVAQRKKEFTFFGRRKIFDIWSVSHLFFGVVMACFAAMFDFSFLLALGIVFTLAVVWEYFESKVGISETVANRITDVLLPLLGFGLTYQVLESLLLADGHLSAVLAVSIFVFLLMNYVSWEARFNGEREFQG